MIEETWYRYEDVMYAAPLDEFERPVGENRLEVVLRKYAVVKYTPKGVWLSWFGGYPDRFVLSDARKRFACPTVEEAKQSFITRKERQVRIFRSKLKRAENSIAIIKGESLWSHAA